MRLPDALWDRANDNFIGNPLLVSVIFTYTPDARKNRLLNTLFFSIG
ncbi:Uncharacterised protein [Salmonella enterica subsp. enterica serovar Bovismorbificans]|nr:Uncharacterised protein [Salmonella enterica subsp. enterica serovar Bovismorbificans]